MIFILCFIIDLVQSQKCQCTEIYFQDLCRDYTGCSFNVLSGLCEEIGCLSRSETDCTFFAGSIKCYWDLTVGFCQELTSCEDLEKEDPDNTNVDSCQNLQCRWDYENEKCTSDDKQKMCTDYPTSVCSKAIQVVNSITEQQCVLNGEKGDTCTALVKCEDITYQPSCDLSICVYENGKCRTKVCADYSIDECPSFNALSQQQCFPSDQGCVSFQCTDFGQILECQTHPRCFWSSNLNSCHQQTCDKATYATQCLSFSYAVENAECKWKDGLCSSCYSDMLYVLFLIIMI